MSSSSIFGSFFPWEPSRSTMGVLGSAQMTWPQHKSWNYGSFNIEKICSSCVKLLEKCMEYVWTSRKYVWNYQAKSWTCSFPIDSKQVPNWPNRGLCREPQNQENTKFFFLKMGYPGIILKGWIKQHVPHSMATTRIHTTISDRLN